MHKTLFKYSRYAVEAFLFICIFLFFLIPPIYISSYIGGAIARFSGKFTKASKLAKANMMQKLGLTSEEADIELNKMWDNLGRMVGELPSFSLFGKKYIQRFVTIDDALLNMKPGSIWLSAHYGNFELASPITKFFKADVSLIYRKANNPITDFFINQLRLLNVHSTISKGISGMKAIVQTLEANRSLGMMVDQKMREGEKLKFFGCDAMTTTLPAKLALKYKRDIVLAFFHREYSCYFHVVVCKIDYEEIKSMDHLAIMQKINDLIETQIKLAPAQWFWIHKRW